MTDQELLEAALSRAAQQLPDDPDRITRLRRARADRRRQRRGAQGVAAVVVLAAVGTGLVAGLHQHPAGSSASVAAAGAGLLGASGTVVAVPGHAVRFCDPGVPNDLVRRPGPPSDRCVGVDVVGVDLAKLSRRAVQDGVISGQAALRGTYAGGVLHVEHQGPPPSPPSSGQTYDHPPCATPAGGWFVEPGYANSANPDVTAAQQYEASHPAAVQQVAVLRPSAHQALVYVLTNGDPTAARAALSTRYPADQLCVARSAYTQGQLAAAAAAPALTVGSVQGVESTGTFLDPATGQPVYEVGVVVETAAMRAAVDLQPVGLLQVTAWLAPVTS